MILRAHRWRNNAALIADVARLGYIPEPVFDATYGKGRFWRDYKPISLTTNDIKMGPGIDHDCDFTDLPIMWDRAFATVVFDPPYKLNGTGGSHVLDANYGAATSMTLEDRRALIVDGARECWRVTSQFLLVKCQDQVCSGRMQWQTRWVEYAVGQEPHDRFDMLFTPRRQPPRRCSACKGKGTVFYETNLEVVDCVICEGTGRVPAPQKHAASNYSSLLVFRR